MNRVKNFFKRDEVKNLLGYCIITALILLVFCAYIWVVFIAPYYVIKLQEATNVKEGIIRWMLTNLWIMIGIVLGDVDHSDMTFLSVPLSIIATLVYLFI